MDTNFYDAVVCGPELAGLIAAALLGRRGLRVLLIGHDSEKPLLEIGGLTLPRAPALLPSLDSPPIARVLAELGLVQSLRRRATPLDGGFQVCLPRHRLEVGPDDASLARELAREWPVDQRVIEAAVARMTAVGALVDPLLAGELTLPPDGFWERRELARVEAQLPRPGTDMLQPLAPGHPFRAVAAAPSVLGTSYAPGSAGAVTLSRAFAQARRGLHLLPGGQAALSALLLGKLETFSGERRDKVFPVEIVRRRGYSIGLRVRPRDETIGCHTLIWAGPADSVLPILAGAPAPRAREGAHGLRPVFSRYTLGVLLRAEALPKGMASRSFFVGDADRALVEENALVVTVGPPHPHDAGAVTAWVECLAQAPAVDAPPGYLAALRGRVRERLGRAIPGFDRHLIALASPHDGLPPEIPGAGGRVRPAALPALPMSPVWSAAEPLRAFDPIGIPHRALGVKNLLVVGRENLPGLGVEGELVAAWGLMRLVTTAQPRRDLMRHQILLGES